jgi:competence protein CoiA
MKFALRNGTKVEAFPGGRGFCPRCNAELVARCGEKNINHWAHKGSRNCDEWWENETEWHRQWKNKFPQAWQEVVHFDTYGEKHIADVKTGQEWVIEFQHSFLSEEERLARNNFYQKIVWVVDGLRRKTDLKQFATMLQQCVQIPWGNKKVIFRVNSPERVRLLQEWQNDKAPIFFDFSAHDQSAPLWLLFPFQNQSIAYIAAFSRREFVGILNGEGFDELYYKRIPEAEKLLLKFSKIIQSNKTSYRTPRRSSRRF